jgi:hypothetical protein
MSPRQGVPRSQPYWLLGAAKTRGGVLEGSQSGQLGFGTRHFQLACENLTLAAVPMGWQARHIDLHIFSAKVHVLPAGGGLLQRGNSLALEDGQLAAFCTWDFQDCGRSCFRALEDLSI